MRANDVGKEQSSVNAIEESMKILTYMFNPKFGYKKPREFQFSFKTAKGCTYEYYLTVQNGICRMHSGQTDDPEWWIETDLDNWRAILGNYISGFRAIKEKKLVVRKGILRFMLGFKRMFAGHLDWKPVEGSYFMNSPPSEIRKVLILSCSSRGEKGATELFVQRIKEGMVEAGAEVDVLHPAEMNIHRCDGCFHCWQSGFCKYKQDDMEIVFNKVARCDLLMWATPIYIYHGSTVMKNVMDRFFYNTHHRFVVHKGIPMHLRRNDWFPYLAYLAVAGFPDKEVCLPLQQTFRIMSKRTGMRLIAELLRPSSMSFLIKDAQMKEKDEVLAAAKEVGLEIVQNKKVSKKTKKKFSRSLMPLTKFVSAGNYYVDKAVGQRGAFFFKYKNETGESDSLTSTLEM